MASATTPSSDIPASGQPLLGLERRWWILITVGIGSFMGSLDTTVVNTVLPVIRQYFATSLTSIEWVVMVYMLTLSILLLSFGRLGDILGHKKVFNIGLIIFTIGSGLCSIAPTEVYLIAFRAFQAIGAAMTSATSTAILTSSFPGNQRGRALGMVVTITYIGVTVGPSLGGFLADTFGWRSIFLVNLPIGVLTAFLALGIIPSRPASDKKEPFDLPGAGALVVGLGALVLAVSKGEESGWTSPLIIGLAGLAIVFIPVFVWLERVGAHPMLDLNLFRSRLFSAAVVASLLNYLAIFGALFLFPFYLVQYRGFSPAYAGVLITAQPLLMILVAPVSGYLSDRIGSRILTTVSNLLLASGLLLAHNLGDGSGTLDVLIPLVLMGIGAGAFSSPNTSAIMGSAPIHRQGIASGLAAVARNLGGVFGVAIAGTLVTVFMTFQGAGQNNPSTFVGALQGAFLVVALVAVGAAGISLVRGTSVASPSREAKTAR